MKVPKRWIPVRPRIMKKFKAFTFPAKNALELGEKIARSVHLKKAIKNIFSVKVIAGTTIVGLATASIMNYIDSNSGCFLKKKDSVCKVRAFSCCQKNPVDNVPFCPEPDSLKNVCENFKENYDDEKEDACCRLCSCQFFNCAANETLKCQRPTVGEALTHIAATLGQNTSSIFSALFPSFVYVFYIIGFVIFLWITSILYNKTR